ncbi:hypothetical protein P4S66_03550 [Pseudoalteromonas sp. B129b]
MAIDRDAWIFGLAVAAIAAFITYFITDNSVKLIGLTQEYWYLTFAVLFVLSGLVSWRLPKMFNKSGS